MSERRNINESFYQNLNNKTKPSSLSNFVKEIYVNNDIIAQNNLKKSESNINKQKYVITIPHADCYKDINGKKIDGMYYVNSHNLEPNVTFKTDLEANKEKNLQTYNCHKYTNCFIDINAGHQSKPIKRYSQFFLTDSELTTNGYKQINTFNPTEDISINKINLMPGDVVCVYDKDYLGIFPKKIGVPATHSGIVLGYDEHNQVIIRQKLNEVEPIVDMTGDCFKNIELSGNKELKIYRKNN